MLLCLGYCHLLHLRDAAACLKCCEALRQLETPQAAHPAVALLAFQAFMAQGSLEQAEQEATGEAGKGVMGKLWGARRRRRAQVGGKGEDKGIVQGLVCSRRSRWTRAKGLILPILPGSLPCSWCD